jgi:hypothetical protein
MPDGKRKTAIRMIYERVFDTFMRKHGVNNAAKYRA